MTNIESCDHLLDDAKIYYEGSKGDSTESHDLAAIKSEQ